MPDPSWAQVITAVATVITALGGLVLALATWQTSKRTKAIEATAGAALAATEQVHTMVNQQRTDAQRYQDALIRALTAAGIEVPIDQSLGPALPAADRVGG